MWQKEVFRWARCRRILTQVHMRRVGMPLPEAHLDILEPALAWEDLQVPLLPSHAQHLFSIWSTIKRCCHP